MKKLIGWTQLKTLIPYARQSVLRLENEGKFPHRLRLGNGPRSKAGWYEHEVLEWIDNKGLNR